MANMSVSGTYRPPYGPIRPRTSGTVSVAAVGIGTLWKFGARLLCRFRLAKSSEPPHGPPQCRNGEDDRVQPFEVPQLGEVEADWRRLGKGSVLNPMDQELHSS